MEQEKKSHLSTIYHEFLSQMPNTHLFNILYICALEEAENRQQASHIFSHHERYYQLPIIY